MLLSFQVQSVLNLKVVVKQVVKQLDVALARRHLLGDQVKLFVAEPEQQFGKPVQLPYFEHHSVLDVEHCWLLFADAGDVGVWVQPGYLGGDDDVAEVRVLLLLAVRQVVALLLGVQHRQGRRGPVPYRLYCT